ncbi:hypothetical protein ACETM9_003361 [Salmonella enterica]
MAYSMWKKGRTDDYKFIDGAIADQYNMGGTDMWLYCYIGPKNASTSSDPSLPDYSGNTIDVSSIGDLIFGESPDRAYNLEAITIPVVYQIQEATPDLKIPGLFFNFNTMDITMHYNTMMQRVGRKIMPGDVIELPNLRDFDVMGKDSGLNRFYTVQDAFRTSEGYSVTWQHHIFKIRVKPLTDSPEYADILNNNDYPDNPDDPNNGNGNSTGDGSQQGDYNNEIDIMNRIIMKADDEVPYIHYTNEHLYNDRVDLYSEAREIFSGTSFPKKPSKNMFFWKETLPVLFEKVNTSWEEVPTKHGAEFPKRPKDGDFFMKEDDSSVCGYTLYQYLKSEKRWLVCDLPYTKEDTVPEENEDFYVFYTIPVLYQVLDDNKTWIVAPQEHQKSFTSKEVIENIYNPENSREEIPPARGTVGEGTNFPSDPQDGEYFYRTDYTPVTLWKFSDETKSWRQFKYGGRLPWTGADQYMTGFLNSPDRVPLQDAVKPNIVYRVHKDNK